MPVKDWKCAGCEGTGDLLIMDNAGSLCLTRAARRRAPRPSPATPPCAEARDRIRPAIDRLLATWSQGTAVT
jgi:hypothetical protein